MAGKETDKQTAMVHSKPTPLADLRLNDGDNGLPKNPRLIKDARFKALCESIQADPQMMAARPIIADEAGVILGGNMRYRAATELGIDPLPAGWVVTVKGWTQEQKRRFILKDNNNYGEFDWEILANEFDIEELLAGGFSEEELKEVIKDINEAEPMDADPQIDRAAELKEEWQTATGQVWGLGRHRLMCGDCTVGMDVEKLLAGAMPGLMVTDPPYGVEYDADWRNRAFRADGTPRDGRAVGKVANDDRADWREAWVLFPGDVIYSWHPPGATSLVHAAALQDSGFNIRMQIIWAKNHFPIGRGDYHVKHEPCWYCVREGKPARFTKDRTQTTLWEIDKPNKSETGHSTQKPVECMARPMRNHRHAEIYDPFVGSGTTIIAAEQVGRTCYAMEISPAYVAVCLQRFMDATGDKPVLLN